MQIGHHGSLSALQAKRYSVVHNKELKNGKITNDAPCTIQASLSINTSARLHLYNMLITHGGRGRSVKE
jgi:hypothetical protein